jgi:hypothetical protein
MHAHQFSHTLYFDAGEDLTLEAFIPVFHDFIREGFIDDDVAIDVADYAHVPDGPGVLLVCHEGHYVIEHRHGRWSLAYHRKRGGSDDTLGERIAKPLRRLLRAAIRLQQDPQLAGKVQFRTDELRVRIQNRLHAPNEASTLDAVRPELEALLARLYGTAKLELQREGEARELFTVRVKADAAPALGELVAAGQPD